MAFTATATPLQTLLTTHVISGAYGIVAQADGSYIAGVSEGDFNFPPVATGYWYKSTNNGTSWTQVGTSQGFNALSAAFPTNIQSNIICIGSEIPSNSTSLIQRSTNGSAGQMFSPQYLTQHRLLDFHLSPESNHSTSRKLSRGVNSAATRPTRLNCLQFQPTLAPAGHRRQLSTAAISST